MKSLKVLHRMSDDGMEYMDFFFIAEKWEGEPIIKELNKSDDMSWFPINNLPEHTLPHVREVIENYKDGISFVEFGWE